MKKAELIKRIKAGALVMCPASLNKGKDWVYVQVDSKNLLQLISGSFAKKIDWSVLVEDNPRSTIWLDFPKGE